VGDRAERLQARQRLAEARGGDAQLHARVVPGCEVAAERLRGVDGAVEGRRDAARVDAHLELPGVDDHRGVRRRVCRVGGPGRDRPGRGASRAARGSAGGCGAGGRRRGWRGPSRRVALNALDARCRRGGGRGLRGCGRAGARGHRHGRLVHRGRALGARGRSQGRGRAAPRGKREQGDRHDRAETREARRWKGTRAPRGGRGENERRRRRAAPSLGEPGERGGGEGRLSSHRARETRPDGRPYRARARSFAW
jgi:hypothetical protein